MEDGICIRNRLLPVCYHSDYHPDSVEGSEKLGKRRLKEVRNGKTSTATEQKEIKNQYCPDFPFLLYRGIYDVSPLCVDGQRFL